MVADREIITRKYDFDFLGRLCDYCSDVDIKGIGEIISACTGVVVSASNLASSSRCFEKVTNKCTKILNALVGRGERLIFFSLN